MKLVIIKILLSVTIALAQVGNAFSEIADEVKQIKIHVVTAIYEPFVMYKDGKLVGFDIDLLNEICKYNNITYTITVTTFQDMLSTLKEAKADLAIGCIYVTEERERWFNFSDSYLEGGLALVVHSTSKISTVYELGNMKVGVKKDSTGDKYAMKLISQGYDITVIRFQDTYESFNALANGKLDAVLNDYLNSVYLLNKYFSGTIKITKRNWGDIVYDRKRIAFAVSKNNEKLLKIISDSIRQLRSQNFIDMLYWKWFAIMPPPNIPKRILFYVVALIITMLFSYLVFQLYARRKRIQQLQLLESHFRNLINDLNVAVYILQNNKIILTNFEGTRLAGTSFDTIKDKTLDDFFKEYDVSNETVMVCSSFSELEKASQFNHQLKRAVWKRYDGVNLSVLYRIRPVTWMGRQAVECVVNDTTEITHLLTQHEQLKGQLLQSQKLEIIGQIAGGIAHDFNNLLTVMLGYANLIEKTIDAKNKVGIEKIIQAGNHAKEIVSKLLTFSRKKAFNAVELNAHTIIQNAISLLHTALSKNCKVILSLHAYNDIISGNSTEIQQMLMNLIINAYEAMPQGGIIYIETENIKIHDTKAGVLENIPAGNYIRFTVKDTGIGITQEQLEHIFEPLYTTKEKGSGLGLSIVYGIVKQHKGFIDVISSPDVGTSFFVYFPVIESESAIEGNYTNALKECN